MDTGELIEAVRNRRVIEIRYRGGDAATTRVAHPHAVFRSRTRGLCLDAVQVSGHSDSGQLPAWRQFALMKIIELQVLEAQFEIDPAFDPQSAKYRHGLLATAA